MAANYTFAKTIIDRVLVWLHGRRLGVFGDGQFTNNSSLVLDGVTIGSSRTGAAPIEAIVLGSNGAGPVTVPGTLVGDVVNLVGNLTTPGDVTSSFEATVSVAGQVQQTAATNLSGAQLWFKVNPQAAA